EANRLEIHLGALPVTDLRALHRQAIRQAEGTSKLPWSDAGQRMWGRLRDLFASELKQRNSGSAAKFEVLPELPRADLGRMVGFYFYLVQMSQAMDQRALATVAAEIMLTLGNEVVEETNRLDKLAKDFGLYPGDTI